MARRELIAACGLIGGLGGAQFGYALLATERWYTPAWNAVTAVTVCTMASATLLGMFLARQLASHSVVSVGGRAAIATCVAGAFNGVLMLVGVELSERRLSGQLPFLIFAAVIVGTLSALPFVPAVVITAVTAANADARPSSIAERSQARRVLRNAMACVALGALLVPRRHDTPLTAHLPLYVLLTAFGLVAALGVVDALVRRALGAHDDEGWDEGDGAVDAVLTSRTLDYGVGHRLAIRRMPDETYRRKPSVREARLGDREAARALVTSSLRGHAAVAAAIIAGVFLMSVLP